MQNSYKAFKEQNPGVFNDAKHSDNLILKGLAQCKISTAAFNAGLSEKGWRWHWRYEETVKRANQALELNLTPEIEAVLDRFIR